MVLFFACAFVGAFLEGEFSLMLLIVSWRYIGESFPVGVLFAAILPGAFLGDWASFELGRAYGMKSLKRWPRVVEHMRRLGTFMGKYRVFSFVILRFQIGMRFAGNYTLGCGDLDRSSFLKVNFMACLVWAGVISGLLVLFDQALEVLLTMFAV